MQKHFKLLRKLDSLKNSMKTVIIDELPQINCHERVMRARGVSEIKAGLLSKLFSHGVLVVGGEVIDKTNVDHHMMHDLQKPTSFNLQLFFMINNYASYNKRDFKAR